MIILNATTKSLEVKLAEAAATTELPVVSGYVDVSTADFTMTGAIEADAITTGGTAITIIAAPAAATSRQVKYLSLYNIDTAAVIVTVQVNNNGTLRIVWRGTLAVGDNLFYLDGIGWKVLDSTGALKQSGSQGIAGANGIPGSIGFSGEDGLDSDLIIIPGIKGDTGSSGGGGAYTLLGEAEGTDTTAAATNVATFAISGLTVKDQLRVVIAMSSAVQTTAAPVLYNATDSLLLSYLSVTGGTDLTAGVAQIADLLLMAEQSNSKHIMTIGHGWAAAYPIALAIGVTFGLISGVTFTTDWTGSWALALRTGAGGVTAGGTFHYRIAVYKIVGQ